MNKTIIATTIATMITAGTANAFFGGDDNQDGYFNNNADGAFDGRGRGAGKGDMDAEGNFSMTINASGKAHSNMEADVDGASNSRVSGINDTRYNSTPHYYGQVPYGYDISK